MDLPIDDLNNNDISTLHNDTQHKIQHKTQRKKRVKKNIPTSPSAILEKTFYNSLQGIKRGKKKINTNDFTIPDFQEYEDIIKYNYSVTQLKDICKYYKLKKTGNKDILLFRVYNYLYFSLYAKKIQAAFRGFLQRKLNKIRGPGFLNRSLCVNDSDFCTLEDIKEIDPHQFYSIQSNSKIYGFDICSLYNYIKNYQKEHKTKGLPSNPYDRQDFDITLLENMKEYIRVSKIFGIKLNIIIKDEYKSYSLQEKNKIEALQIFQRINELGNYSDQQWFLTLDKERIILFLRELYDIWNYRANLSQETKCNICSPYGRPFRNISVYNFTMLQNRPFFQVQELGLKIMSNFIKHAINDDFKALGAYYILGALTLVNHNAANSLPWLFQSVSP